MRAIIGKYKVSIDEMTLICTHPSGISFDLTLDEALGLMKFIKVYQDAIAAAQFDVGLRTKQIDINNKSTSKDLPEGLACLIKGQAPQEHEARPVDGRPETALGL